MGFGPVQTRSQLVWDRTSPTLASPTPWHHHLPLAVNLCACHSRQQAHPHEFPGSKIKLLKNILSILHCVCPSLTLLQCSISHSLVTCPLIPHPHWLSACPLHTAVRATRSTIPSCHTSRRRHLALAITTAQHAHCGSSCTYCISHLCTRPKGPRDNPQLP